jgi:hypothetical protein
MPQEKTGPLKYTVTWLVPKYSFSILKQSAVSDQTDKKLIIYFSCFFIVNASSIIAIKSVFVTTAEYLKKPLIEHFIDTLFELFKF